MRNRKKFLAGMLAATMVLNMALSVDVMKIKKQLTILCAKSTI